MGDATAEQVLGERMCGRVEGSRCVSATEDLCSTLQRPDFV